MSKPVYKRPSASERKQKKMLVSDAIASYHRARIAALEIEVEELTRERDAAWKRLRQLGESIP